MSPINSSISQSFGAATTFPKIVRNGLVFYVDAGQQNSYNTGTTWRDLSGRGNNGTLTNGATYNSGNSGYMTFDGSNQYVGFSSDTLGVAAGSKTMCAWIYPTSYPNSPLGILDMDGTGNLGGLTNYGWGFWIGNTGKLWYWPFDNLDIIDSGSRSVSTNAWNFVSVSYNFGTKTADFYYNGVYSASGITTATETPPATGQNLIIGATRNGSTGYFAGRIAIVSLYNRVLSSTEILQNFQTTQGRFGI